MIHFHNHNQTLIDPCSLNKTGQAMIAMPLTENPSEQINSNLTFKLSVGPMRFTYFCHLHTCNIEYLS